MTTPTPHGAMPELPNLELAITHGATNSTTLTGGITFPSLEALDSYTRAAIQQAAGAVPEGWKLVPLDPTQAMKQAGHLAANDDSAVMCGFIYRAMLNAAPEVWTPQELSAAKERAAKYSDWFTGAASPSREAGKGGSSDHVVPCAGGGVTQPLTEDQAIQLVDEFAFEVGRSTVAVIEDLDKMHPEAIAIKQAFNRRHTALVNALMAPRPDAPTSQINPGSASREDGHG